MVLVGQSFTVVGGGLTGPLLAIALARLGARVEVFDRRDDPRTGPVESGRSINLALAEKGLAVLRGLGLEQEALADCCVPMRGRMVHRAGTRPDFVPYGRGRALHAVSRLRLNRFLLDRAEAEPGVRLRFGQRCVGVDPATATTTFRDTRTGRFTVCYADAVVGADGTGSVVRDRLVRGRPVDYQQRAAGHRYLELRLPAGPAGEYRLEPGALHVWPRGEHMMFALPNPDGSFNLVLVLPASGPASFGTLTAPGEAEEFLASWYPDVASLLPTAGQRMRAVRSSPLVAVSTSAWLVADRVVLVGDACHTVLPFYGQGLNAGFEDCAVLVAALAETGGDRAGAFSRYAAARRPHTDVLAELSERNFEELRDLVGRPWTLAERRVQTWLEQVLGERAAGLYTLVVHTRLPYADCVATARRRRRTARWCGLDAVVAVVAGWEWLRGRLPPAWGRWPQLRLAAVAAADQGVG